MTPLSQPPPQPGSNNPPAGAPGGGGPVPEPAAAPTPVPSPVSTQSSPIPTQSALASLESRILAWVKSKGGWSHAIAIVWGGAILAYAEVPAFHTLVISAWGHTPAAAREIGLAVSGLLAWYLNLHKATGGGGGE
jgi:hypothetical protein